MKDILSERQKEIEKVCVSMPMCVRTRESEREGEKTESGEMCRRNMAIEG